MTCPYPFSGHVLPDLVDYASHRFLGFDVRTNNNFTATAPFFLAIKPSPDKHGTRRFLSRDPRTSLVLIPARTIVSRVIARSGRL